MKPVKEMVYPTPGYSFCIQHLEKRRLHFNWHYHEEVELVIIRDGNGHVHIGDIVRDFASPAVFLIGSLVPHGFLSMDELEGWIIQFQEKYIRQPNTPNELSRIRDIIEEAKQGLLFCSKTAEKCITTFHDFSNSNGLEKWLLVLKTLDIMAQDPLKESCSIRIKHDDSVTDQLDQIISQIYSEITKTYNLDTVSKQTGMKVSTFCKTFKKRYGMSFTHYIHSIRINIAKKMLIQTNFYIDDISLESGFNNVSFFIRKFRELTGMTPSEYRRRYRE